MSPGTTGPGGRPRCAVLGSPIAHSLSPVLHTAAYDELGLDWTYERAEVREDQLAGFLAGLDDTWRGLSLTMPLKRAVLPLLDEVSPVATTAGAANTVLLREGRRVGENTDVPGAVAAIRERWAGSVERAVVIGGGATAGSLLVALADLGCREVTLLVRDATRATGALAAVGRHPRPPQVHVEPLEGGALEADLVASTIPARAQTPALLSRVAGAPVVFEVVYDGWPTPLAAAASGTLVSGLDLLVHQAALQVPLMTGVGDPAALVPVMRAAGEQELR